jgi:predicted small secreted protein
MKKRLLFAALVLALLVLAGRGALMGAGRRLRPAVN